MKDQNADAAREAMPGGGALTIDVGSAEWAALCESEVPADRSGAAGRQSGKGWKEAELAAAWNQRGRRLRGMEGQTSRRRG